MHKKRHLQQTRSYSWSSSHEQNWQKNIATAELGSKLDLFHVILFNRIPVNSQ